jgi:hypothetical protein
MVRKLVITHWRRSLVVSTASRTSLVVGLGLTAAELEFAVDGPRRRGVPGTDAPKSEPTR